LRKKCCVSAKRWKHQDWVPLKAAASDLELAVRRPTPEMIAWAEGVLAKPKDAAPAHRLEQPYAERTLAARDAKPDTIQAVIQAFRIGDLGIASIPFEVFTEIGLEIKARSPFKDTFTHRTRQRQPRLPAHAEASRPRRLRNLARHQPR